jgi:hypothetical protein
MMSLIRHVNPVHHNVIHALIPLLNVHHAIVQYILDNWVKFNAFVKMNILKIMMLLVVNVILNVTIAKTYRQIAHHVLIVLIDIYQILPVSVI